MVLNLETTVHLNFEESVEDQWIDLLHTPQEVHPSQDY